MGFYVSAEETQKIFCKFIRRLSCFLNPEASLLLLYVNLTLLDFTVALDFTVMALPCSVQNRSCTDHICNVPCNLCGPLGD